MCLNQDGRAISINEISLTKLGKFLFLSLKLNIQQKDHKTVLKEKLLKELDLLT